MAKVWVIVEIDCRDTVWQKIDQINADELFLIEIEYFKSIIICPFDKRTVITPRINLVIIPAVFFTFVAVILFKQFKMLLCNTWRLNEDGNILSFFEYSSFAFAPLKVFYIDFNAFALITCRADWPKVHLSKTPIAHLYKSLVTLF